MMHIIAIDSIDRLEDDVDFVGYFKSGQGLEHLLFNLTDEDLEKPELKEAIKKVFSIIPGAQSMEKRLGTRTLLKGIIKKFPEDPRVVDFIKVASEIDLSYINEKIENVSELKRVISSDKNPEEFIDWLANEATALGIYWSFGDGFAYDADKSHQYKYTFVTNVSKDDVDIKRTQLASLKFHRNEQEIRLKQGVAIKLTQVLSDGSPLQLPPEVSEKTFYTSESDIEGSKMLHIEKLASSEDLELSRGEIGVSIEDYDPSKDKEKSTKNRWREKPNQNTAVKPAYNQESDNYKKDKLDKAKYTNFLGRTDQDKPVRVMDFATPGQYVGLDDYFTKHTDTLQDDQQQYDTRNFGKGKMQPKQHSNFLYKSELLHTEVLTKVADLNSKKPYLLQQLNKAGITGEEAEKIIKEVNSADPSGDKAVYTQWILKQYINDNFKGEEDVDKFKDTLNKFTKLKNSKKIDPADLNQYNSYGELVQKVQEILDSTSGYTSNKEEELAKERDGIKLLDAQNGIELYLVNTPEAASKEFRNTDWCVKDPRWFKNYASRNPNFYYFTKGEEPFLLLHENDFRNVYDGAPHDEDLVEVAPFMIEHNLPKQYVLLLDKIITRENDKLFTKAANQVIDDGRGDDLLLEGIITREDGDLFIKAVNKVMENSNYYDVLLKSKILTKEDGELYTQAISKTINSDKYYNLLKDKILTKKDGELFNEVLNKALEEVPVYLILRDKIITREDKELFHKLINQFLEKGTFLYLLLDKVITREDGDLFTKAVNNVIDYGNGSCYLLLHNKMITKEDGELYTQVVNKAIEENRGYDLVSFKFISKDDSELYNKALNNAINQGWGEHLVADDIITSEELEEYKKNNELPSETSPQTTAQYQDINKTQFLHITTVSKVAAGTQDSAGTTSITPTVTDKVTESVTQKPVTPVTQSKGGKPTKGVKAGGTRTRPVKAFYLTNLKSIDIIADQFGDGVTRTELPESSVRRFRQEEANDRNKKEQDETRKKMKGKPNKPLHNVPKKDVYAWGNDDLIGGTVFYSDMSLPQMGDLSEIE